jgi:hypothetical protein
MKASHAERPRDSRRCASAHLQQQQHKQRHEQRQRERQRVEVGRADDHGEEQLLGEARRAHP